MLSNGALSTLFLLCVLTIAIAQRCFSHAAVARNFAGAPASLSNFTEEELMLKDTGKHIYAVVPFKAG